MLKSLIINFSLIYAYVSFKVYWQFIKTHKDITNPKKSQSTSSVKLKFFYHFVYIFWIHISYTFVKRNANNKRKMPTYKRVKDEIPLHSVCSPPSSADFLKKYLFLFILAVPSLSYSTWGIVPWLGIKLGPPTLGGSRLSHWTTREVPSWPLLITWCDSFQVTLLAVMCIFKVLHIHKHSFGTWVGSHHTLFCNLLFSL